MFVAQVFLSRAHGPRNVRRTITNITWLIHVIAHSGPTWTCELSEMNNIVNGALQCARRIQVRSAALFINDTRMILDAMAYYVRVIWKHKKKITQHSHSPCDTIAFALCITASAWEWRTPLLGIIRVGSRCKPSDYPIRESALAFANHSSPVSLAWFI